MILVDIYVPSVGNTYDFQVDETAKVQTLVEEIAEMVGQKEHCSIVGDLESLMLCTYQTKQILPKNITLSEANITTGQRLLLL